MITKFKLFEELNAGEPEVGDWIIVNNKDYSTYDFINSSIGYIWKKYEFSALVKYVDIPIDQQKNFMFTDGSKIGNSIMLSIGDIVYWSKNKEELEHIIQAKKYNL